MNGSEGIRWTPRARVDKYDADQVDYVRNLGDGREPCGETLSTLCDPWESIETEGNLLTTAGLTRITAVLIGTSSGTLDSTRVRLGVGDSSTAAVVGDTALGTNQYFRVMDATYPQASAGVLTFVSSFGSSDANFAWNCWGIDVGTATVTSSATVGTLINRKVSSQGTKATGTWVYTVTITLS